MKKRILLTLAITLLLTGCAAPQKTFDNTGDLVVGMELAYPPFETKDENGDPMGLSVDLARALGEYLGRPVVIENINWDGLIPSLQSGKVDVVLSSMTITEERAKTVDFTDYYAKAYLALLVNSASPVEKPEDLNQGERTMAVKKGTSGAMWVEKTLPNASVNSFTSEAACVMEVTQGKADAFIYDQLTIYRQNQENLDTTKAMFIQGQVADDWGMAVEKGNSELVKSINAFIKEFREKGGFEDLTQKFLSDEKQTFDQLDFPWFFE